MSLYFKILVSLFVILSVFSLSPNVAIAGVSPAVRVVYLPLSGVSFRKLSEGVPGRGLLLYYSTNRNAPTIIVELSKNGTNSDALAVVFQNPQRKISKTSSSGGIVKTLGNMQPSLKITALGGWWTKNTKPNYNLLISVYGPIYSMWGQRLSTSESYLSFIKPHELLSEIQIAVTNNGIPLWDYRQLVPQLPGMGVYRVNYAQRESTPSSWQYLPSVSPLWPYVAYSGHFLQSSPAQLTPPIVVNWATGQITRFSEVVSVRSQTNGYDFYSITPWTPHSVNHPDFESPWGFYNLASTSEKYPNLIIRTQHFYANDPWSVGNDPGLLLGKPLLNKPQENVRYSWAVHPGNGLFDYKVDVYGFHPYTGVVPLAGGAIKVQAPSYQSYPSWVIGHRWPSTIFVDSQSGGYPTTEGIYPWAAQGIGTPYWMGWSTHPDLQQFDTIPQGLRGEYRIAVNRHPRLYVSPVDNRIHLLYAQGGLWNLGGNTELRESNLNNGPYINEWTLAKTIHGKSTVISQLFALPNYLVYSSNHQITIKSATYAPSLFTILPPSNKSTWTQFVERTAAYRNGNDPYNLSSWLDGFYGYEDVGAGSIRRVVETPTGFSIMLTGTNVAEWAPLLSNASIPANSHNIVLSYSTASQAWSVQKLQANAMVAAISPALPQTQNLPTTLQAVITNHAKYPQQGSLSVTIDNQTVSSKTITVDQGQRYVDRVNWTPSHSGILHVTIFFNHQKLVSEDISIAAASRPTSLVLWGESVPSPNVSLVVTILTIFVGGLALVLWRRTT